MGGAAKVIIVGGGVSGLVASFVFSHYQNMDIKVLEPGKIGGEFLSGGLRYLHRTDALVSLLNDLGMVFSNYSVRGGILLRNEVHPYPKVLSEMEKPKADRVRFDHYRKTRRQEPSDFGSKSMNDPESEKARGAIRCDYAEMIAKLAARANIVCAGVDRIAPRFVTTTGGNTHWYDYLVLTIPLWIIKKSAHFYVPEGHAMRLNIIDVAVTEDQYGRWDYIYTPYTPGDSIHRISSSESGYYCEVNGELRVNKYTSDLNFLFKSGWAVKSVVEGLKGHLLPLSEQPEWPDNVVPIGRFAKWDPRSTVDVVIDDAKEIAESWGWKTV